MLNGSHDGDLTVRRSESPEEHALPASFRRKRTFSTVDPPPEPVLPPSKRARAASLTLADQTVEMDMDVDVVGGVDQSGIQATRSSRRPSKPSSKKRAAESASFSDDDGQQEHQPRSRSSKPPPKKRTAIVMSDDEDEEVHPEPPKRSKARRPKAARRYSSAGGKAEDDYVHDADEDNEDKAGPSARPSKLEKRKLSSDKKDAIPKLRIAGGRAKESAESSTKSPTPNPPAVKSAAAEPDAEADADNKKDTVKEPKPGVAPKRKLPTIKKNKPPAIATPAGDRSPIAALQTPANKDKRAVPTTISHSDFDLRDSGIYDSLFKGNSGLQRREKEEARRKELHKMRDEARAQRMTSYASTFDLQSASRKIERFEASLGDGGNSPCLFPNILAAKFRHEWQRAQARRERDSQR